MAKFHKDMKTSDLPIPNLGLLEISLIQIFIYSFLWVISEFTATLITLVLPGIFLFLLLIALVAELLDSSRTPRWYFKFMILSILLPILTAFVFVSILGADFDWTKTI
ncbi:MAG: hypothetical protein AAGJ18_29280 [Bacteroidota bacterium]